MQLAPSSWYPVRGRTNSAVLRSGEALWMVLPSIQESFAACAASAGFSVHLRLPVAWVAGAWCRGSRQQGGLLSRALTCECRRLETFRK